MSSKFMICVCMFLIFCASNWISLCEDCINANGTTLFHTQFVNISGDATFSLHRSRKIFIDVFFPFYTEVYRLQPRRMIIYISKYGEVKIQDKSYESRVTIKSDDDTLIIDISDIGMEDAGLYSVEIPRKYTNNCFKVYVLGTPKTPVIKKHPSNQYFEEGKSVTLTCTSVSRTEPPDHNLTLHYSWQKDGQNLQNNKHYMINGSFLKIPSVNRNDSLGNFTCWVHENYGLSSFRTSSLSVRWGPKQILDLEPPTTVYLLELGDLVPVIHCLADCSPACSVEWTKVGNMYKVSNNSDLDLGHITSTTTGEYVCIVRRNKTNKIGFRSVTVQIKEKIDAVKSIENKDNSVVVGSILGTLLLISLVVIGILVIRSYCSEVFHSLPARSAEATLTQTVEHNHEPSSAERSAQGTTYEELDRRTRNQDTYESLKQDHTDCSPNLEESVVIYEN